MSLRIRDRLSDQGQDARIEIWNRAVKLGLWIDPFTTHTIPYRETLSRLPKCVSEHRRKQAQMKAKEEIEHDDQER